MKRHRISLFFLAILCSISQYLPAQTVVTNHNIALVAEVLLDANYRGAIDQSPDASKDFGDITSVWFDYDGTNLTGVSLNLDEGSDWYLVSEGDAFGFTELATDQFTPIIRVHDDAGGVDLLTAEVGAGEFYIGVATSGYGSGISLPCHPGTVFCRNVFGWAKLRGEFTGSLQMVSSAVAYGSSGIIVGSSQAITEMIHSPYPPDFNQDGWTNGPDFVEWQRGASPNTLSPFDLLVWETRFGEKNTPGRNTAVPEPPPTTLLVFLIAVACQSRRPALRV